MRALVLACGVAAATVGHGQEASVRPERVVVTAVGSDADAMSEACSGFFLTAKQAGAYFERAKIIDAFEEHDHYAWAPCWVRGTARVHREAVSWEIRAALTARIVFPNGKVLLLADPSQRFSEQE